MGAGPVIVHFRARCPDHHHNRLKRSIFYMSLTRSDVERIAHLARLALREEDVPVYTRTLSDILDLVAQMNAVDTREVAPMAHPLDMAQRLRQDEVTEHDQRGRFQAIAPQVEDGLYLVPRVIE